MAKTRDRLTASLPAGLRSAEILFGIAIGLIVSVPLLVFLGFVPKLKLGEGLLGALLGGLLSGSVAIAGQVMVIRDNVNRHTDVATRREFALANGIFQKAMDISDIVTKARNHYHTYVQQNVVELTRVRRQEREEYTFWVPLAGAIKSIEFTYDELGLLLQHRETDFLNDAVQLAKTFAAYCHLQDVYRQLFERQQSAVRQAGKKSLVGRTATFEGEDLDPEIVFQLEDALRLIREISREGTEQSAQVLQQAVSFIEQRFDRKITIEVHLDTPGFRRPREV